MIDNIEDGGHRAQAVQLRLHFPVIDKIDAEGHRAQAAELRLYVPVVDEIEDGDTWPRTPNSVCTFL